jgi:integrase
LVRLDESFPDSLTWWMEQYFKYEVTTAPSSQHAQQQDITRFIMFMLNEEGNEDRPLWSPRLSRAFQEHLRAVIDDKTGRCQWSDSSIKRIMAHLKTFSKWINKLRSFPLGDPMIKVTIKSTTSGTGLEIERALIKSERRRILDAADQLPAIGGRSRDRKRFRKKERPQRKGYRPYRNRAIIYTLIETGMKRAGAVNIILNDIDFKKQTITTGERRPGAHLSH